MLVIRKLISHCAPLALFVVCFSNCSTTSQFEPVYDVPEPYQSLVDTFIYEANIRGIDVEISNLIIKDDPAMDIGICGKCNSNQIGLDIQKVISINPGAFCWDIYHQLETLVFHELGHCVLGRVHLADTFPNGAPKSLMIASNRNIYTPCIYQLGTVEECNLLYRREYYLDELFNPSATPPDWSEK